MKTVEEHLQKSSLSVSTAIFQVDLGLPIPKCLHSGFYRS